MTSLPRPARWAAVLCLLACTASAQRLDRLQRRLDRRDRLGGAADAALLRFSFSGDCEGAALPAGLTFSRTNTSTTTCVKADGSMVELASGVPAVESRGLMLERGANFYTVRPDALTTAPWATAFGGSVGAAPTLTSLGGFAWQVDFGAVSGAGSFQLLRQSIGARTTARHAVAVDVRAVSGTWHGYLSLTDGTTYLTAPCFAVQSQYSPCFIENVPLSTASWTLQMGTDLRDTQQAATASGSVVVRMPQLSDAQQIGRPIRMTTSPTLKGSSSVTLTSPITSNQWCVTLQGLGAVGGNWFIPITGTRVHWLVGTANAANSATLLTNQNQIQFIVRDPAAGVRAAATASAMSLSAHDVTACNNNGALSLFVDGRVPEGLTVSGTGTGVWDTFPTAFRLGNQGSFNSEGHAFLRGLCVSGAQQACNEGVPTPSYHACPSCGASQVAAIGDSITLGSFAPDMPYPRWLQYTLGPAWGVDSFGVSGSRTDAMLTRWRNRVKGQGWGALVLLGGINDVRQDVPGATAWANLQTILDEARAEGLEVVPVTALPFGTDVNWTAGRQTALDTLNSNILAYCTTWGLTCVDAYAAMGEAGTPTKLASAYDSGDGLHPNVTGNKALAELVRTALLP